MQNQRSTSLKYFTLSAFILMLFSTALFADEALNPKFNYMKDGKPVAGWGFQLGDPGNWSTPVDASLKAKSASGKLFIEPVNVKTTGDGLKLSWKANKEMKGAISLYGAPLDLSAVENVGAIAFDLRIDVKPNKDVTFGMSCGYPCGGEVQVGKMLKDLKTDEWTTFPIPLNCFSKAGLDLKKVNSPMSIGTEGKLGITITNVRLIRLPDGEKGCAEPTPTPTPTPK